MNLSSDHLREALEYRPDTGHFTWKVRPREHFGTARGWAVFNAAYAGKRAGHLSSEGYITIGLDKKVWKAHRLAWWLSFGPVPAAQQIDHKNRDRRDNRLANLRLVGPLENAQNASQRRDNTSGLRGACFHRASNRWAAQISIAGRRRHLGLFDTAEAAHTAWAQAVLIHHVGAL